MIFFIKRFFLFLVFLLLFCLNCRETNNYQDSVKIYYPSGELKREMIIRDSLLHGTTIEYYKSGQIKLILELFENIPINNQFYYSENGKLIGYNFHDLRGELRYQVHWDSLNGKYIQDGKSLYLQGKFNRHYHVGDTISLIPAVANPFKSNYKLSFILDEEEKVTKNIESDNENSPLFLYIIEEDTNHIKIKSTIFDNNNVVFKADSVLLKIVGNK
jgi:hypothetical protein